MLCRKVGFGFQVGCTARLYYVGCGLWAAQSLSLRHLVNQELSMSPSIMIRPVPAVRIRATPRDEIRDA